MATKQNNVVNLSPQEGKQRKAFDTKVDVMIYGGAAGSGKSRLLLIKALKHAYQDPNFEGVMFRRTTGPLKGAGGLFTESKKLFRPLNPRIREKDMEIIFEGTGGGNLKYTHLEHEDTAEANHQGLNCSPYIK